MEVRDGSRDDYLDSEGFDDGTTGTHSSRNSVRALRRYSFCSADDRTTAGGTHPSLTSVRALRQLTPSIIDLDQYGGDVQSGGKCQTDVYDCTVFRESVIYDRLFKTSLLVLR